MARKPKTNLSAKALRVLALTLLALGCIVAVAAGSGDVITTYAGNGENDYNGDTGQATGAAMGKPTGVAFESSGALLIADGDNNLIRAVASNGIISTPVLNLNYPRGIAVAPDGGIYVANAGNGSVRRIAPGSSTSTLVAGGLASPYDVAVDPITRDLYIADPMANKILRVPSDGGTAETFAGTGFTGPPAPSGSVAASSPINAPRGIAFENGELLVAETGANRIVKIDASGHLNVVASQAAGNFDEPSDVAATGDGREVVADYANHKVKLIDGATVTTIAGTGTGGFSGDTGPATSATLNYPISVAVHDSVVYVADEHNNRVRRFPLPSATPDPGDPGDGGSTGGSSGSKAPSGSSGSARSFLPELGTVGAKLDAASRLPAPAAPIVGRRVAVQPYAGSVRIRLPGSPKFVALDGAASIPVGAIVDTRKGQIRLTSAANAKGKRQTAVMRDGIFRLRQRKAKRPTTEFVMVGALPSCKAHSSAASISRKRQRKVRRLWGRGHGHFRTRGHYGAATVRGTIWGVYDRCDGTLVRVKRGLVQVDDFARHRKVMVAKGHHFLVRKPHARKAHR